MAKANAMLRVMSYNIRYDNPRDGENGWNYRKAMVASMVRFHHAGLVGLQEVMKNQLDDLAGMLPEFAYIGVGRNDGKDAGEFTAIFYLRDRFTVRKSGHFWLSATPDQPGVKGWDAACIRMVTWAEFTDQVTGAQFYHFNTHFDHIGMMAQRQSAYLLLNQIEKIARKTAVLVTGDFNCTVASPAYRILTGKEKEKNNFNGHYLADAEAISIYKHHGPSFSLIKNFNPDFAEEKIDYILIKNKVRVIQHGILADHFDRKYSSDHLPVVADLEIAP